MLPNLLTSSLGHVAASEVDLFSSSHKYTNSSSILNFSDVTYMVLNNLFLFQKYIVAAVLKGRNMKTRKGNYQRINFKMLPVLDNILSSVYYLTWTI